MKSIFGYISFFLLIVGFTGCVSKLDDPPEETIAVSDVKEPQVVLTSYLVSVQNEDGSWGKDEKPKPVLTALCLLGFASIGITPADQQFGTNCLKGLKYLITTPDDKISHPIIIWSLCEHYYLTKIPKLKDKVENEYNRLIASQDVEGKFNYDCSGFKFIREDDSKDCLLSQAWCLQAVRAGYSSGIGKDGDVSVINKSKKYICGKYQKPDGTFSFLPDGEASNEATAVGLYFILRGNKKQQANAAVLKEKLINIGQLKMEDLKYPFLFLYFFSWDPRGFVESSKECYEAWQKKHLEFVKDNIRFEGSAYRNSLELHGMNAIERKIYAISMMCLTFYPTSWLPTFKINPEYQDDGIK